MGDQVEMRILYPFDDLAEKEFNVFLSELVLVDKLIQFTSLGYLHNNKYVSGGVEYLVQFDDVRMTDKFKDFDFACDLRRGKATLEIMFLFFILSLFNILMATRRPVSSCLASSLLDVYL
jgi:hypothetical protein